MADEIKPPMQVQYRNVDTAPIVYFDTAPTFGILGGAIQVDLSARIISPAPDGGTLPEFITSGRLRCSPSAAVDLINALQKSLEMLQGPQQRAPEGVAVN